MPRQKFTDDEITRNYPITCPVCGQRTYITGDDFECHHCHSFLCPNCLKPMKGNTYKHEWSNSNGAGFDEFCLSCGYPIAEVDLY